MDRDLPVASSLCGGRLHYAERDGFQDQSFGEVWSSFGCRYCAKHRKASMFPLDFATHPTLITLNNPNSKTYFSQEFVSQLQFPKKWAQNTAMFTKSRFGQPLGVGSRAGGLFWHLSWDDVGPLPGGDRWPGVARDADALDARDLALDGGAVLYLHCLYGLCVAATGFRDIKKTRKNGDLGCFLGVGSSINGDSTDKHG